MANAALSEVNQSVLAQADGLAMLATKISTNVPTVLITVLPMLNATTLTEVSNASADKATTVTAESMDLDAKMLTNVKNECIIVDHNQSVTTTTEDSAANVDQDLSEIHQLFDAPSPKHQRDAAISTTILIQLT